MSAIEEIKRIDVDELMWAFQQLSESLEAVDYLPRALAKGLLEKSILLLAEVQRLRAALENIASGDCLLVALGEETVFDCGCPRCQAGLCLEEL